MKSTLFKILILGLGLNLSASAAQAVTIEVVGLRNTQGQILIAAYTQAQGFPEHAPVYKGAVISNLNSSTMRGTIDLPPGVYAFSLFHDENMNGILDMKGQFPAEEFGFSNNPTIIFSAPSFKDCAVNVTGAAQVISIKLKRY